MSAALVAIGDELLIGRIQDTNSRYIADALFGMGLPVVRIEVVSDDAQAIQQAVRRAWEVADVVLCTGGLGPTADDRTKDAIAQLVGPVAYQTHAPTYAKLEAYYAKRGRAINPLTAAMAEVPVGAEVIPNEAGAAPGLLWAQNGKLVAAMPGVPVEMRAVLAELTPRLIAGFAQSAGRTHIFRTIGIPESNLVQCIADLEDNLPDEISFAYNPLLGQLDFRVVLNCPKSAVARLEPVFHSLVEEIGKRIEAHHFADDKIELAEVVVRALAHRNFTFATAESCTGGALMADFVAIPGASAVVRGSTVAYLPELKTAELGVPDSDIQTYGVVSEPVALAMAEGARRKFGVDVALSTTGVAGPTTSDDGAAVGTLCVGLVAPGLALARTYTFDDSQRGRYIRRFVLSAQYLLWQHLSGFLP